MQICRGGRRTNHPERYVERVPKPKVPLRPIFTSDIPRLQTMVGDQQCLIDPWLKSGSIIQLYAYSGAGKSRFIQTVMWHLSMGNTIGGFDIERPARVLYLDYELGLERVLALRLLQDSYGDPGEEYGHWSPAVLAQGRRRHAPGDARGQQTAARLDHFLQSRGGRN